MHRILLSWRGWTLYSFSVLLYIGMVAGVLVAAWVAQLSGLDAGRFALALVILIVPGCFGTRLFYVASHWALYRNDRTRIWRRSDGGAVLYGGLLAAVPLSVPLLRAMDLPFGKFWDATMFAMLVGMIFARFGCLLNGCCSGRVSASWFALDLADHRGIRRRRVPTQLLEAGWAAVLLAAISVLFKHRPVPGAIICFGVFGYVIGRYFLQQLRDRETVSDTGVIQVTSVLLALASLIGIGIAWTG